MPSPPVPNVKINNFARYVGIKHGQDWYEWAIYVDEPEEVLRQIKMVEYLLHRSFPNPLRSRVDSSKNFLLESSGWGEFPIRLTVFFKNGSRIDMSYRLDLSKSWNPNLVPPSSE